jgi:hypothetical protein
MVLAVLFVVPVVASVGGGLIGPSSRPLELITLEALRNLGLGLAILGPRGSFARLAVLVGFFLVLAATTRAEGWPVAVLAGAYALIGSLWLMRASWARLRLSSAGTISRTSSRSPLGALLVLSGVLGAVVTLIAVGPERATAALGELVSSSGGTGESDPNARGGVHDGDNEVSGTTKPRSVGFSDSETYLETDRPSLYDAISEQYGEPFKKKTFEKMIAIGPDKVQEQRRAPTENLRAGREFSTTRRPPERMRRPGERAANALVYVQGPMPVHLPMTVYDRFDGRDWAEAPELGRDGRPLERDPSHPSWLVPIALRPGFSADSVRHRIKIGTLSSSSLPVPAFLSRLKLGSVDRPDFFGWSWEGLIRMVGRKVPAGSVLETDSWSIDPEALDALSFAFGPRPGAATWLDASALSPEVRAATSSWGRDRPRGWPEVMGVVAALRSHAEHDRSANVPESTPDPIARFVLQNRRGPDYLFATTAALVLRERGYPTRLVTGLYASDDQFDRVTRHAAGSVHTWVEVRLPAGQWMMIEPTPGFEVAGPRRSLWSRLGRTLTFVAEWSKRHALDLLIGTLAFGAFVGRRHALADASATLAWLLFPGRGPRAVVLRTYRLLEHRGRWAGVARPGGQTPRRWLSATGPGTELDHLSALLDWCLYRPPNGPDDTENLMGFDPRPTCRSVVRTWTRARLKANLTVPEARS